MAEVRRKTLDLQDSIFALASGPLPSAVAIIRVSGSRAFEVAARCFHPSSGSVKRSRGMWFGEWCDLGGKKLDSVLLLGFISPHSFTAQDVIEIQCHGSVAIVRRIESDLLAQGLRPAQRGEFSLRAFHGGKLSTDDLEALGDLFLATQSGDLERIYQRKDHSIASEVSAAREDLIRLQAILDTAVDFSEEYASVVGAAATPLGRALDACRRIAERYESLRGAVRVPRLVLAGRPNAGKSSLFNALLCRYRAIVHEAEGTTRDAIEEDFELGGRRWKLVDTAGVRAGVTSEAERQGLELGEAFLGGASYWVLVVDGTLGLSAEENALLDKFGAIPHTLVWNKQDLGRALPPPSALVANTVSVSARTGEGVGVLAQRLSAQVSGHGSDTGPLPFAVQATQLREAAIALEELGQGLQSAVPPEVLGEANRGILRKLESVVGGVGVEDVLDRVFSEFCIGK